MESPDCVWLTSDELAKRLKINRRNLDRWASSGGGPPFAKFGKVRRYKLTDVAKWEIDQYPEE